MTPHEVLTQVNYFIERQDWVGLNGALAMQDTENMAPEELVAWARYSAPVRSKLSFWEVFVADGRQQARRHDQEFLFMELPE